MGDKTTLESDKLDRGGFGSSALALARSFVREVEEEKEKYWAAAAAAAKGFLFVQR